MSKKLLPVVLVLGIVGAACAQAPAPLEFGSGARFLTAVVDPLNDAGVDPSVVVVNGQPYVAYFAFEEQVPEGSFAQSRPIGLPTLPGVMLATVSGGVWTRGAIAIKEQITNVQVAFNPAFEPSVGKLTAENVTGLQLVADANGGLHAVWGSAQGLFYASGTSDPASSTQWTVEEVAVTPPIGPSLALDAAGNPWISYMTASSGSDVVVASKADGMWMSDVVATGAGCDGCRTAIAVNGSDAPVVAYGDGTNVTAVTRSGDAWRTSTVERGGSGIGLAATAASSGSVALSYETASQVHVAVGTGPGAWQVASVGDIGEGDAPASARTTGVAIDEQGSLTLGWFDPGTNGLGAATSADGTSFAPADLGLTTGGQSPSVATAPDGSARFMAWYASDTQNLMLGAYTDAEVALAVPSPTPTRVTQPSAAPSTECAPVVDGKVTVVAEGIAFTDGNCIDAPAGEPFTIVFDNRDAGVQHNIEVFTGSQPSGDTLFQGDLATGPTQVEYQIPALDPGEYAYNCVVHPTMIGKIQVTEGGGGGGHAGGGGGQAGGGGGAPATTTVTAQGIAFDTSTITLVAGKETTITFDNQDASVQHNIAIYKSSDPADLANPLFRGDLVTGVATTEYTIPALDPGTYYFQCDVHPTTMNGQVIVE